VGIDKPDDVADNPHALPYASDRAAPVIRPDNVGGWKLAAIGTANKHFEDRFEDLKQKYQQLVHEFRWNEILFNAEMRFKPVIGKSYYLYKRDNMQHRLSLFAPHETMSGAENYIGSFRLNYDNRWEVVELKTQDQ